MTIRRGDTTVYCKAVQVAAVCAQLDARGGDDGQVVEAQAFVDPVLVAAQSGAKLLLGRVLCAFPELGCPATTSFGTAIRAAGVRHQLESVIYVVFAGNLFS